jgi:hypothetical protein
MFENHEKTKPFLLKIRHFLVGKEKFQKEKLKSILSFEASMSQISNPKKISGHESTTGSGKRPIKRVNNGIKQQWIGSHKNKKLSRPKKTGSEQKRIGSYENQKLVRTKKTDSEQKKLTSQDLENFLSEQDTSGSTSHVQYTKGSTSPLQDTTGSTSPVQDTTGSTSHVQIAEFDGGFPQSEQHWLSDAEFALFLNCLM